MKLKTLIADDEPLARERLRALLAYDTEIEIVAECRNSREVVAAVKSQPIDLAFLDIEMPGTNGFDVIEQVGTAKMPHTIFVTAHNNYAVKAFEVHALDYLMKPLDRSRLHDALARVKERIAANGARTIHAQLSGLLETMSGGTPGAKYAARLVIPSGSKDVFVKTADIEWIEAADYYALLHVGGKTFTFRETIKQLASSLDPTRFVRVHRSAIVNIEHVKEIGRDGRAENWVVLCNGERIKMSPAGRKMLLDRTRS